MLIPIRNIKNNDISEFAERIHNSIRNNCCYPLNNDIKKFADIMITSFRNNCCYPLNNDISEFAESPTISTPDYASQLNIFSKLDL